MTSGESYLIGKVIMLKTFKKEIIISKLKNLHPGENLEEEFLKPMGITAYKLSQAIDVP